MKVTFEISEKEKTISIDLSQLGVNEEDWHKMSKSEKQERLEDYWNDHRDSVVYWNCKEIHSTVIYKVIDEQSKFYGKEFEYASCSSIENWSAVILYTSGPDSNGLRDSHVFLEDQVVRVGAN